jgi:erythromycin 3''-O-methyltransferase
MSVMPRPSLRSPPLGQSGYGSSASVNKPKCADAGPRQRALLAALYERWIGLQYAVFARRNPFTHTSRFLNMGYWKDSPPTLDAACLALAQLVGRAGALKPGDRVLAVGSGFGEEAVSWLRDFAPSKIIGIDIAGFQVRTARAQAAVAAAGDRIEFVQGSATSMLWQDHSFDKVVSIEAAFHFFTRVDFLREAFRVLRPDGRLVITDIIPRAAGGHALAQISPSANLYGRDTYVAHLRDIGFSAIELTSIREDVLEPYCRYVVRCLDDPAILGGRVGLRRRFARKAARPESYEGLDYVLVTASR